MLQDVCIRHPLLWYFIRDHNKIYPIDHINSHFILPCASQNNSAGLGKGLIHTHWGMAKYDTNGIPDSKVHGANMGSILGRQDPGGPHVGPVNFVIWDIACALICCTYGSCCIPDIWIPTNCIQLHIFTSLKETLWKIKNSYIYIYGYSRLEMMMGHWQRSEKSRQECASMK